jgi:hypothetical protein
LDRFIVLRNGYSSSLGTFPIFYVNKWDDPLYAISNVLNCPDKTFLTGPSLRYGLVFHIARITSGEMIHKRCIESR